jgi:hypothetical protein
MHCRNLLHNLTSRGLSFVALGAALVATSLLLTPQAAHAQQIFFGEDINTTDAPGGGDAPSRIPTPNATAAYNAFLSGLTAPVTENFEGFANGSSPALLTFGPDTATLTNGGTIRNQPTGTLNGTYPMSGDQFLLATAGGANAFTLNFSSAQSAFGFFATDIGDGGGQLTLRFLLADNVTTVDRTVPTLASGSANTGSVFFYGVFDTVQPFTRVTFTYNSAAADGFGIDDITIAQASQVAVAAPEPASLAMLLPLLGTVGVVARRRKK